ncbi:MAG: geranylgeranylglycerol-phosphate geranylgeranyltransferase [Ignavibacteriaceae bacterium]
MLKKFSYFQLVRPLNILITFFVIIVAAIISINGNYSEIKILLAGLAGALTAAAGNIINDYFDIEVDKINRPSRPLASNKISKKNALIFYVILIIISILISTQIIFLSFIIVFVTHILLFLYSYKFKNIVFIGNFIIAFLTGLAFIFGGAAVNNISNALIPAAFAFLINLIREIIKDVQDMEGDKQFKIITLPSKIGIKKTKFILLLISLILFLFTFYPFITQQYEIEYFIFVMAIVNPILVYVIKSFYYNDSSANLNKLSFILKLDMIFGLTAIFLGK